MLVKFISKGMKMSTSFPGLFFGERKALRRNVDENVALDDEHNTSIKQNHVTNRTCLFSVQIQQD